MKKNNLNSSWDCDIVLKVDPKKYGGNLKFVFNMTKSQGRTGKQIEAFIK